MKKPLVIIILGLPGTGKTTLGRQLAEKMQLPFFCRDDLKEILFETLGWQDRKWSQKLGQVSYVLLYYMLAQQLAAGKSCIVETAFNAEFANREFKVIQARYDFDPIQVLCQTEAKVLLERFRQRSIYGERHPGHVDHLNQAEMERIVQSGYRLLNIGGKVFEVDTTDFATVNIDQLLQQIKAYLAFGQ
jgi:shikimate kinase